VREHNSISSEWPPIGAPLNMQRDEYDQHWSSSFDSSVNAVSFGFVATAILISMFLVMAIFERFLKPTSPPLLPSADWNRRRSSQMAFNGKLAHPSPKVSVHYSLQFHDNVKAFNFFTFWPRLLRFPVSNGGHTVPSLLNVTVFWFSLFSFLSSFPSTKQKEEKK